MIDDLLAAGMNFTLDSTNLVDHGLGISEKLVGLCGNPTFQKAPLLLNRVLEKCPNTFLAEDKVGTIVVLNRDAILIIVQYFSTTFINEAGFIFL